MADTTTPEEGEALVLFGLTGDLGEKKLLPAIAELHRDGTLSGPVIGVGRSDLSSDELWQRFQEAVDGDVPGRDELDLRYISGDSAEPSTYDAINEAIGSSTRPVIYAAIPPALFATVAEGISGSALPAGTRLVLEKPFGDDRTSAADLHDEITSTIASDRLFIVDHFLAKSAVENLLAFRAANPMVEAALDAGSVKRIEITMAEAFGVDGRGGFYDDVGAVKDVVQNHLLQTIAVLLMDPPVSDAAEDYNAKRSELLRSIEPVRAETAVFGQHDGYTDLDDVDDESTTETFVAFVLRVASDRWRDVEILVRTGKEMRESYTEAVIVFSDDDDVPGAPANRLRFQIKPDSTVLIEAAMLDPAEHGFQATTLWACAPSEHQDLSDYATMLKSALLDDRQHFATIEGVLAAWAVVEPLLADAHQLHSYEPGSMGPTAARELSPLGAWIDGPAVR